MTDDELEQHIADARWQFERAYDHHLASGNPHDRDAAVQLKTIFEDACRLRRARATGEGCYFDRAGERDRQTLEAQR